MKHCPLCNWPMRFLETNHLVRCLYSKSVIVEDERQLRKVFKLITLSAEANLCG